MEFIDVAVGKHWTGEGENVAALFEKPWAKLFPPELCGAIFPTAKENRNTERASSLPASFLSTRILTFSFSFQSRNSAGKEQGVLPRFIDQVPKLQRFSTSAALRPMDIDSQNGWLAGRFWELKSTGLKVAKRWLVGLLVRPYFSVHHLLPPAL